MRKSLNILRAFALFLWVVLLPMTSHAGSKYWVCGDGQWDDGSCWSATAGGTGGDGQPQNGDSVYLVQTDSANRTVSYANTTYPNVVLGNLRVDATGTGTMTLFQSKDNLLSYGETIGMSGTGTFTQSGGSNTVSTNLSLGEGLGSNGNYVLGGTGTLSADSEYIGNYGTGTFTQTGGGNTVNNEVFLGYYTASQGNYELAAGTLNNDYGEEYVGYDGAGTFTQTGGTNNTRTLYLGYWSGGGGTYELSQGVLGNDVEYIGYNGTGEFVHTGGANGVFGGIYLGYNPGSSGTYTLSGTATLYPDYIAVGYSGAGIFKQNGGSVSIVDLGVGVMSSGNGTYDLSGGNLRVEYPARIGNFGVGTFNQTGGTYSPSEGVQLGVQSTGSGTYNLSGGKLSSDFSATEVGVSGIGIFNHSGGTHTIVGTFGGPGPEPQYLPSYLYIGYNAGSSGTYNLSGTGSLSVDREIVGSSGVGVFVQSGGTNTVPDTLTIAKNPGSSGTYTLSGGTLAVGNIVNNDTFNFDGGRLEMNTFQGDLTNNGGTLAPGSSPGTAIISGDYFIQSPSSILEIEVGGLLAGEYDVLDVTGTATLSGDLNVLLWAGFTPELGNTFDILVADTILGGFDSMSYLPIGNGLGWDVSYILDPSGSEYVRLSVVQVAGVPEPASILLLGTGLLGVIGLKRKERTSLEV